MRRRSRDGGFGTAVGVVLVLALLGVAGYFIWQKKARGELSISVDNMFPSERVVSWAEFSAILKTSNARDTVVVRCIPVQIDDVQVTCVPPSAATRRNDDVNVQSLGYEQDLRETLTKPCNQFNAQPLYLTVRLPDAVVVNVRTGI